MSSTDKAQWTYICHLDSITNGGGVNALVKGEQVAIFKIDEQVFAIHNFDPFAKANVLSRGIVGDVQGQTVVASPIYKQHFNLQTGQCLEDDNVKLQAYPVRVFDNTVFVGPPA